MNTINLTNFFETKTVLTSESYEKINSQRQNQKKTDSAVVLSSGSGSKISSSLYLKPKSSKQRSYVYVKDSFSAMNETYNMASLNGQQFGKEYELQAANPLTTSNIKE